MSRNKHEGRHDRGSATVEMAHVLISGITRLRASMSSTFDTAGNSI